MIVIYDTPSYGVDAGLFVSGVMVGVKRPHKVCLWCHMHIYNNNNNKVFISNIWVSYMNCFQFIQLY